MKALEWIAANPTLVTLAVGMGTATFNWATKPRTPEELAAMSPRRAAFHRFMAAAFPDPQKAIEAAWQFWNSTREKLPSKKPGGSDQG